MAVISTRRGFLFGGAALLAAPAIIPIDNLMKLAVLHRSMSRDEIIAAINAKVQAGVDQFDLSLWNPLLANTRYGDNSPFIPQKPYGITMRDLQTQATA